MTGDHDRVLIESAEELRRWLQDNQSSGESVWLVTWKKGSGQPSVSYGEIVDQCLCFGWIDSLTRKLDEKRTMLRISPRNPKSNWSRANKERAARLIRQDLMEPRGKELIEIARKTGTWSFLDDVERLEIPGDLREEFEQHPGSRRLFDRFPRSSKRAILEWIKTAKRASTRQKRVRETAAKAAKNIKANHPGGQDAGPPEDGTKD